MTTPQRSRPSVAQRSRPARRPKDPARYRRTRAAIALFLFLLVFSGAWILNGEFTAQYVMALTGRDAATGWAVHFVLTAIEIAPLFVAPYLKGVPREYVVLFWALSLPFGVFDVLSSAVGVAPYLNWTGATGLAAHVQNTIAAEIIGFLPERAIFWLLVILSRVMKG